MSRQQHALRDATDANPAVVLALLDIADAVREGNAVIRKGRTVMVATENVAAEKSDPDVDDSEDGVIHGYTGSCDCISNAVAQRNRTLTHARNVLSELANPNGVRPFDEEVCDVIRDLIALAEAEEVGQ